LGDGRFSPGILGSLIEGGLPGMQLVAFDAAEG
jgi:hypothetical protein